MQETEAIKIRIVDPRSETVDPGLQIVDCRLWTVDKDHGLWIVACGQGTWIRIVDKDKDRGPWTWTVDMDCGLRTEEHRLEAMGQGPWNQVNICFPM